YCGFCYHWRF
ncbi:OPT oligopeptide transporter protein, partial [Haemophilus influenzae]